MIKEYKETWHHQSLHKYEEIQLHMNGLPKFFLKSNYNKFCQDQRNHNIHHPLLVGMKYIKVNLENILPTT